MNSNINTNITCNLYSLSGGSNNQKTNDTQNMNYFQDGNSKKSSIQSESQPTKLPLTAIKTMLMLSNLSSKQKVLLSNSKNSRLCRLSNQLLVEDLSKQCTLFNNFCKQHNIASISKYITHLILKHCANPTITLSNLNDIFKSPTSSTQKYKALAQEIETILNICNVKNSTNNQEKLMLAKINILFKIWQQGGAYVYSSLGDDLSNLERYDGHYQLKTDREIILNATIYANDTLQLFATPEMKNDEDFMFKAASIRGHLIDEAGTPELKEKIAKRLQQ